jgi:hypothetical protein
MQPQSDEHPNHSPQMESFDGIRAIQAHLDQKSQIEQHVQHTAAEAPGFKLDCHADCVLAQWLHSEPAKHCNKSHLLNAACKSCEEFYEAATQAVMLANMGMIEQAQKSITVGQPFEIASDALQTNFAQIHIACWSKKTL